MYARLFFLTLRTATIFPKFESVNMETKDVRAHVDATARSQIQTKTKTLRGHFPLSEIRRGI
jgi:hypothetical protein